MKKVTLPLAILCSFFILSCEPEEMTDNPKLELEQEVSVYSETGDQADPEDKKWD